MLLEVGDAKKPAKPRQKQQSPDFQESYTLKEKVKEVSFKNIDPYLKLKSYQEFKPNIEIPTIKGMDPTFVMQESRDTLPLEKINNNFSQLNTPVFNESMIKRQFEDQDDQDNDVEILPQQSQSSQLSLFYLNNQNPNNSLNQNSFNYFFKSANQPLSTQDTLQNISQTQLINTSLYGTPVFNSLNLETFNQQENMTPSKYGSNTSNNNQDAGSNFLDPFAGNFTDNSLFTTETSTNTFTSYSIQQLIAQVPFGYPGIQQSSFNKANQEDRKVKCSKKLDISNNFPPNNDKLVDKFSQGFSSSTNQSQQQNSKYKPVKIISQRTETKLNGQPQVKFNVQWLQLTQETDGKVSKKVFEHECKSNYLKKNFPIFYIDWLEEERSKSASEIRSSSQQLNII